LITKCLCCFENGEKIKDLETLVKYYENNGRKYRCNDLACGRNCSHIPRIEEILEICNNKSILDNHLCREWLLGELIKLPFGLLKLIVPWFINLCLKNYKIGTELLIPLCVSSEQLIYTCYFELLFFMQDKILYYKLVGIMKEFVFKIGKKTETELQKSMDFVKFINENIFYKLSPTKWNRVVGNWMKINGPVKLPWNTSLECVGVVGEGVVCFNSATKPWKIPIIVKKNGKEGVINVLVKFEDVRKDKLTMIISKFLQSFCPDIMDIETYNVLPIDDGCGWIEMVEQSNTLYDIKYKYNTTLQNYVMDRNPDITVSQLKNKFIKTCVSSCVLCYVMGVGDRHLENILVTKDGKLLHIDFSYILGDDPKNLNVEMKITEDMLLMLGGIKSRAFNTLKTNCTEAYQRIRLRSSLWYILLSYLDFSTPVIDNYKYSKKIIQNHVIEKLLPGENDAQASMQIINIVERSSQSNWQQNLADFSHNVSNAFKDLTQFNLDL